MCLHVCIILRAKSTVQYRVPSRQMSSLITLRSWQVPRDGINDKKEPIFNGIVLFLLYAIAGDLSCVLSWAHYDVWWYVALYCALWLIQIFLLGPILL